MRTIALMISLVALLHVQTARAAEGGVWYAADQQAVAIDLGHPAWDEFPWLDLDFNGNRLWGQTIDGGLLENVNGTLRRRFSFGIFKYQEDFYGSLTTFGWSPQRLYDGIDAANWVAYAPTLYTGERSPEGLHCFTDLWQEGSAVVYCRPLGPDSNSTPVLPDDLDHVFVRQGSSDWVPVPQYAPPLPPLRLGMEISPNTLSAGSQGNFVTVKIALPTGVHPSAVDMGMTIMIIGRDQDGHPIQSSTKPIKWTSYESGTKSGLSQLSFKLARREFASIPPGTHQLLASSTLGSGRTLIVTGEITIR